MCEIGGLLLVSVAEPLGVYGVHSSTLWKSLSDIRREKRALHSFQISVRLSLGVAQQLCCCMWKSPLSVGFWGEQDKLSYMCTRLCGWYCMLGSEQVKVLLLGSNAVQSSLYSYPSCYFALTLSTKHFHSIVFLPREWHTQNYCHSAMKELRFREIFDL